MQLKSIFLLTTAAAFVAAQEPKEVFAHFIVGNAAGMTHDEWVSDINLAKAALIDGFALNIGVQDPYTDEVLKKAYSAAAAVGDFTLFLSFDYLSGGPWPVDRVVQTINKYKKEPAQFKYKDMPLVSTFEGVNNVHDWDLIKPATGCFFMPSWTSLGLHGHESVMEVIDGVFSWDAWPVGAQSKSTHTDEEYMSLLGNKPYMMPVSPWFYTNLPQWGKNWLWRGDDLWHDRWQQVIQLQPAMVQVISWNDYGESHYIGPIYKAGIPTGAAEYVVQNPHDDWRTLLPVYINLYKSNSAGNSREEPAQSPNDPKPTPMDIITYWYRLNPSSSGSSGGTTGNNPSFGQKALDPGLVSEDKVFTTVFAAEPSVITIEVGQSSPTTYQAKRAGINHFNAPFNGHTGAVLITIWRNENKVLSTTGPEITDAGAHGRVNWNAYVGSSLNG
ncbi:hypothetical protein RJ035_000803 [Blastomyces gilchristii]